MSGKLEKEIMTISEAPLFKHYEKGEIGSSEFRDGIRALFSANFDNQSINTAWNAMIGDTPLHRLEWLSSLKDRYRIFILSNTNHIHVDFFHGYLYNHHGVRDFSQHVEKVYYSQLMGMRKPDREIFDYVVKENELEPKQTLFLDDNTSNTDGAKESGIQTILVDHPENVPQLLANAGVEI